MSIDVREPVSSSDGLEVGVAVGDVSTGRWYSVAAAATELNLPEKVVYRQIASQQLKSRRDERGALLVCLDDLTVPPVAPTSAATSSDGEVALTPDRARALSEFASGLLEPLLSRLAHQEEVIRQQAEELGRLRSLSEAKSQKAESLAPAIGQQLAELAAIREEIERLNRRPRWWPFR